MALNAKTRRHSGRITPRCFGMKKEILIEEGIEPQVYWDDWKDYRDGFRGRDDRKMIRSEYMRGAIYLDVKKWNQKLKLLLLRRMARKSKKLINYSLYSRYRHYGNNYYTT